MTMTSTAPNPVLEDDFFAARRGDRDAFARLVRVTQRMVASVSKKGARFIYPSAVNAPLYLARVPRD